jgi:hypothetical protein
MQRISRNTTYTWTIINPNTTLLFTTPYLPSGSQNPTGGRAPASFSNDIFIVPVVVAIVDRLIIGRNAVTHTADRMNRMATLNIIIDKNNVYVSM